MYIKTIFKFVDFERSYNVSKLANIQHNISHVCLPTKITSTKRSIDEMYLGKHLRFKNACITSDSCHSALKTKVSKTFRNRGSVHTFPRQGEIQLSSKVSSLRKEQ